MKIIKYFFQSIFIYLFLIIFKILGYENASAFGSKLMIKIGPFFRNKNIITSNIKKAFPKINNTELDSLIRNMWSNYGRMLGEYIHLKNFRNLKLKKHLTIKGEEILKNLNKNSEQVIFISGHFNNFELMAMEIERSEVKLTTIYRPLNNIFLNKFMEKIRFNYICKKQIKKGISGTRDLLKLYKEGYSVALMIDQRVSEGIKSNFFNHQALTSTMPAQLIKKFKCKIVPIYIERKNNADFVITINNPIAFNDDDTTEKITNDLNKLLEKMILKNPDQWIWSHDRWK